MTEKIVKVKKVVEDSDISINLEVSESYYNKYLANDKRYSLYGEVKQKVEKHEEIEKTEKVENQQDKKSIKDKILDQVTLKDKD